MTSNVCGNFENFDQSMNNYEINIGYSKLKFSRTCFIIIPCFGIIINLFIIIIYFRRKKNNNESSTSMEKMIFVLTLIQLFISISWLFNGIAFYEVKAILDHCTLCLYFSLFSIFAHTLYLFFFIATFQNLRTILNNPVDGILKFRKRFIYYITFSLMISIFVTCLAYVTNSHGISPMLTCYIRNHFIRSESLEPLPFTTVLIGLVVFITISIYIIYLGISIYRHKLTNSKRHYKNFFMKYLLYGLIFILFNIPTVLLYLITINRTIPSPSFYSYLSYLAAITNITIDFGLCCVNIFFGQVKLFSITEDEKSKSTILLSPSTIVNMDKRAIPPLQNLTNPEDKRFSFKTFENEVMENFLRDILIGICHTVTINKYLNISNVKLSSYDCQYHQNFKIKKRHIKFEDETVMGADRISINFITFAPYVFKKLIYLDNLTEDDLIESLMPMKNKLSISESQGKSGDFFIFTDDNEFILKTITDNELNLITTSFIRKYTKYIIKNNDSLICRLYGLFQIKLIDKHVNVILMKNVTGKFKPNIVCKYDLKGSTINREVKFDIEKVHKIVMKDNNFEEIEKYLYLENTDINKLQKVTKKDSDFLTKLDLMDYSLLVLKMSMREKDIEEINGNLNKRPNNLKKYFHRSIHTGSGYILAIIDYFQKYNFYKLMETNIKFYIGSRPDKVTDISCVPPDVYSKRFVDFIEKITSFNIIEMSQKNESSKDSNENLDYEVNEKKETILSTFQ